MEKEITIFICEDKELARRLIRDHLANGQMTYVNIVDAEKRQTIVDAIEEADDNS